MSAITSSARGERCQIRLPHVCKDPQTDTVVWCHANGSAAGKGIGMKSADLLGAYGCQACHDIYDRRVLTMPSGMCREDVELSFWEGHARSLVILTKKGLVRTSRYW